MVDAIAGTVASDRARLTYLRGNGAVTSQVIDPDAARRGPSTRQPRREESTMTETTVNPTATEQLIDTYFDMWRATDPTQRAELVARVFAADGRHVDPLADVVGHDALNQMLAHVHTAYPGFTIDRTSGIDQHGAQLRYAWQLNAADGTPVVAGLDVVELADDGRLARVASFWGDLPAR
jgi:hypothetical protein